METLQSLKNPKVAAWRSLKDRKGRKETGCFLVEGRKMTEEALRSGFPELDRAEVDAAIAETALPPTVRGETLSLAQFAALSNALLRRFDK